MRSSVCVLNVYAFIAQWNQRKQKMMPIFFVFWVYFCVKQLSMPCPLCTTESCISHLCNIPSSTISLLIDSTLNDADEIWSGIPVLNYCIVFWFSRRRSLFFSPSLSFSLSLVDFSYFTCYPQRYIPAFYTFALHFMFFLHWAKCWTCSEVKIMHSPMQSCTRRMLSSLVAFFLSIFYFSSILNLLFILRFGICVAFIVDIFYMGYMYAFI